MTKEEGALYRKAIKKWGRVIPIDTAIVEMAELTQALCKSKNAIRQKDWIFDLYAQIADVQIMLDQLKIISCGENMVAMYKSQKLEQLEERLKKEG